MSYTTNTRKMEFLIREIVMLILWKENPMTVIKWWPVPVAAWSNAWVCGQWLAGIVGSNPAGGMDVCLL